MMKEVGNHNIKAIIKGGLCFDWAGEQPLTIWGTIIRRTNELILFYAKEPN